MNEDDGLGEVMPAPRKLRKLTTAQPVKPEGLQEGDMVIAQVTHEVEAYGNRMWVRFGASTTVQPGESGLAAQQRLQGVVRQGVEASIKDNVQHAQEMSE